jgi:hypothetical protein
MQSDLAYVLSLEQDAGNLPFITPWERTQHEGAIRFPDRAALRMAKKVAFDDLGAHRLWLDVKTHNVQARALYDSEGFIVEGLLRESVRVEGGFESLVVMSMLQHEFASRRTQALEVNA